MIPLSFRGVYETYNLIYSYEEHMKM